MTRWRILLALALALTVGLPLAWPLGKLFDAGVWLEPRGAGLAWNTALLVTGTLALALPAAVALAILVERTDLPGRRLFAGWLLIALFIPLPLLVSGWQVVLGAGGVLPVLATGEWTPWSQGMGSAVFLHALAGLPWVVLIVGLGLRAVERELEDDARTIRPPGWVLWHVSLRRALTSIAAAALWVAMQTAGEIIITDLMQVRTFAEEVYTQLVGPESAAPLGRAVAASLAGVTIAVALVLLLARQSDRLVPTGNIAYRDSLTLHLGRTRWPFSLVVGLLTLALLAVPVSALVYRAGLSGAPASWSASSLLAQIRLTALADGWLLPRSLLVAVVSGALTATVALTACWLARESRWFRVALLLLVAVAWAMPGPIIGLGLKGVFRTVLDASDGVSRIPAVLLWYGPSIVPLLVVNFIRFLPFAVALVWPAVQRLPRELFDTARLDGATPGRELVAMVWPLTRAAWTRAVLAVAILSLGELSAGKIVSTPQAESFAEVVWTQMHFGVTADLAARCLVLLGVVVVGTSCLGLRASSKRLACS